AFQDPRQFPSKVFGWGSVDFSADRALGRLLELFNAIGVPGLMDELPRELAAGYQPDPAKAREQIDNLLQIPLYAGIAKTEVVQAGIDLLSIPAEVAADGTMTKPPALVLQPRLPKDIGVTVPLSDITTLAITGGSGLPELFGIVVRPKAIELRNPLDGGASLPLAQLGLAVDVKPQTPWLLLGRPQGSRLTLPAIRFGLALDVASGGSELRVELATDGLNLHLEAGDGDGFIGKLLGDNVVDAAIALAVRWSTKTGLSFAGGGGFELSFPLDRDIGPFHLRGLHLALGGTTRDSRPAFLIGAGVDVSAAIGPVAGSVEDVGVEV